MSNRITSAETAADSDTQPIVTTSDDIEANPMLAAVFLSTKDKQEQFHKDLKALLIKYKAELTMEEFGANFSEDWKIVVDFKYDESFVEKEDTGIVPQLILGRWADGS